MARVVKVPIIMQMEALECGAACLCMVMAYHGKWLPLEQLREECGVSRDGSKASSLVIVARAHGLKAQGYRKDPEGLRDIPLPAIIHWNFNHFVVFCGFKKGRAVLNDPGRGRVEVSMAEFDEAFTGVVLCFEKTENFTPSGKPRSVWEFAKARLKGTAPACAFVMLTGIMLTGVQLLTPVFSRIFMDQVLSGQNAQWLSALLAAMTAALIFQFAVNATQALHWLKIEAKLAVEANASFMWHVLRLPVGFFAQRYIGDIASRQSSNEQIAATLIGQLAPVFLNLLLLVAYLGLMIRYNALLAAVGIAAAVMNLMAMRLVSKRRVDMSRVALRDGGKLMGATMSGFEMIETIKASGAENAFFQRWAGYFAKYHNAQVDFQKANQFYGTIPPLLQQICNIAILMIGVYLILDGTFTIGMLLAFQGFTSSFLGPVQQLVGVSQSFIEMRSQMERVEDVFNYRPDVESSEAEADFPLEKLKGEVELRNVTFGYSKTAPPLIEDFSLKLKPGGSIAFVGSSGSGKSTLGKLISGLYQPWSGQIFFDGIPRERIPRRVLTSSIAVVDQDIVLFEDTIFDNVTLWDKSIDEAAVIQACRDAQIHEDIMLRDGGYGHVIREGGKNFSGGQRQRLEIARALAQQPTVLILDEATSALDTKTEQLIMEAVKAKKISLIVIAHRLSTIRDCDEIIVLDNGRVAERGTHEQLIELGGKYSALVST